MRLNDEKKKALQPIIAFFVIYMILFEFVEKVQPYNLHIIHCSLDHYIPFLEVFVIPYLLWFAFIAVTAIVLFYVDFSMFCRFCYTMMFGMALFIAVSYIYPNGLDIRPEHFPRENIFVELTRYVYKVDTPTNVLPSIHVYNSICALFAIWESEFFREKKMIRNGAFVLSMSICLSTMFLKQHSVFDVVLGLLLSCAACEVIYHGVPIPVTRQVRISKRKWAKEFTDFKRS